MDDLDELQKEIERRKELQVVNQTPALFEKSFDKAVEKKQQSANRASQLIEAAFDEAIIHKVKTDENIQENLLVSADKVIQNKTNVLREQADQEDKEAYFKNKKNACECFGYNETTTEKWAVKVMSCWHNIMTAIWLCIGFFTFAPITFVAKKVEVIFKKSWVAVTVSIVIYLIVVVGIPLLTNFIKI